MQKKLIIDNRMRNIEKTKLKELGYKLLEVKENKNLYPEISSHVDILACKVGEKIVVEPTQYANFQEYENFIKGQEIVLKKYPLDIKYNVCIIGKKAIHNFQNTDSKLKELLINDGYELINTTQGYTNCSVAVIDESSVITTDRKIAEKLIANNISVLLLDYTPDIKLKDEYGNYSNMNGFIGGAIGRVDNNIIVFGDLNKIDRENKIRDFIKIRNLKLIDFKDLDVIDYGGIVEV